jgi:hypothetical protein
LFVRCDDPSSHFSTVAMKIENRLSTLTNKIKENLSLLGDGCSLLTLVNNENEMLLHSLRLVYKSMRGVMTNSIDRDQWLNVTSQSRDRI